MKIEHKEAIERARLHGVLPSVLANELMVHDLVDAALFELRNIHSPYSKLNEGQQQEVITRITDKVKDVVSTAVAIISSRNVITIPCKMKQIQVTEKTLTVTSLVDAKDPSRHGLTDSAGHLCLLVLAPDDYADGLDFIRPDRDQSELALHSSNLTASLFDAPTGPDEPGYANDQADTLDELYGDAVAFVIASQRATTSSVQRELKIGYNRAARIIEALEQNGVIGLMDHTGDRVVLMQSLPSSVEQLEEDPLLEDALGMVNQYGRLGPAAIAGGFGIDTERANDILVSLEKAGHVVREGDSAIYVASNPAVSDVDYVVDAALDPKDSEFGEFGYNDAAQLVVLHAKTVDIAWLQRRLAIDSDKASTLLLRLLDDGVIKLETEADDRLDNTYTVIGELSALTSLE